MTLFSVRIANCEGIASEASLLDGLMCVHEHMKSRKETRAIINLSLAGNTIMNCVSLFVKELIAGGVGCNDFKKLDLKSISSRLHWCNIHVAATDMDDMH